MLRKCLATVLLAAGIWLGFAGSAPLQAAQSQKVDVRTGLHDGYARIVVEWNRLPPFQVLRDGMVVTMRFAQPLSGSLDQLVSGLEGRITGAEFVEDSHALRIYLAEAYELRAFPLSNMAVLDLIGDSIKAPVKAGTPAPKTAAPVADAPPTHAPPTHAPKVDAPAAAEVHNEHAEASHASTTVAQPEPSPVADAEHHSADATPTHEAEQTVAEFLLPVEKRDYETFSRLIFMWPDVVAYAVSQEGDTATLHFDKAARIDLAELRAGLPVQILSADTHVTADAIEVTLALRPEARLRHFQKGSRVVLDVVGAEQPEDMSRPSWATQSAPPATDAKVAEAPAADKHAAEPHEADKHAAEPHEAEKHATEPHASEPQMAKAADAADHGHAKAAPDEPPHTGQPADIEAPLQLLPTSSSNNDEAPARIHEAVAVQGGTPTDTHQLENAPSPTASAPDHETTLASADKQPDGALAPMPASLPLEISAEPISDGLRLRFHWNRRVGAAVFVRMGYLWVVFDVPRVVDFDELTASNSVTNILRSADQFSVAGATVLRFGMVEGYAPRVARGGQSWLVELSSGAVTPSQPMTVTAEPDARGGARVLLPASDASRLVSIGDPEVGDRLVVVPVTEPGLAVAEGREFVQFDVPVTAQGAFVVPRSDGVRVSASATGVEVSGVDTLYLSAAAGVSAAANEDDGLTGERPLFAFDGWQRSDLGSYVEAKQKLQNLIAQSNDELLSERRLELARFFFAHGFAADAVGVIQRINAEHPEVFESVDALALRGATLMMLNRTEEAARDLSSPILDGNLDVTLWRAALAASDGKWEEADSAFAVSGPSYERLPPKLKSRFGLLAAHAALAIRNYHRASRIVDRIITDAESDAVIGEATLLQATVFQQTGKNEAALDILDDLSEGSHRPVRARAELARIELLLGLGQVTRRDAIQRLESLRHAWRGDSFEQRVLKRLGELYREERDYMNALNAMRDAVEGFPDASETPLIREAMNGLFKDLFVKGDADVLTPLAALGLFYEFGELAPHGADGGRIVEGLARRLVAIDLLDRASALLDHQIDALEGADKARMGARLAVVRLLDKDPSGAIEAIHRSQPGDVEMPEALSTERRLIEARALALAGTPNAAVALLAADESRAGRELRADILWRGQSWAEAAAEIEQLYTDLDDVQALDDQDRAQLMRQAIAMAMYNDADGLARLRTRFMVVMADSKDADAFDLLTRAVDKGKTPFRELPALLANVEGAEAFRQSYADAEEQTSIE